MKKDKRQCNERYDLVQLREFADHAFSRASGAPLIAGNHVRLLKDAKENHLTSGRAGGMNL
jgi:hypothetical protein